MSKYERFKKSAREGNYFFSETIDGIDYYVPNDESNYVVAVSESEKIVKETNFYEMDDFYEGSDYLMVVEGDTMVSAFSVDKLRGEL